MKINKNILQALIKGRGGYFIGDRQTHYLKFGERKYENKAVFFSPNIPRELQGAENIGEKPYDVVERFAESEVHTNIFLGKNAEQPFQWGIRHHEFVSIEPVTCRPMDLIVACYEGDIKDYYKVLEKMKELSGDKIMS